MVKPERLGLVQVYTGDGKGKTTAALGLALRAAGAGMRVYIGQFLQGMHCGELESIQRLAPHITLEQYGLNEFVHVNGASPAQLSAAEHGLQRIRQALTSGEYDIVVADEINIAIFFHLLTEDQVLQLIDAKLPEVELVLTGRRAPASIIERADLVTEMREVRHPYQKGVLARAGIEF
ncbi:MAG TPA: cob(I)yrinic acid a,c-diamide adenosyltransferase [Anaerolineae bacterium]|nr:cob(I)yrinic acid a,c-diamide adenosyltransferase [Anaerolineae bacterium]